MIEVHRSSINRNRARIGSKRPVEGESIEVGKSSLAQRSKVTLDDIDVVSTVQVHFKNFQYIFHTSPNFSKLLRLK
jgi:hypothetical protein